MNFKTLLKATLASTAIACCFWQPTPAKAQSACAPSGSASSLPAGGCKGTPDKYEIVIYEMGLCTADPLSSSGFDNSSCTATFESAGGTVADLSAGATVSLGSSGSGSSRPADGTYTHAYIILANTFGLNITYTLGATTWVSTASAGAASSGTAADFTENLTTFGDPSGPCTPTANESVGGGTLKAIVTDSTLTQSGSCTGISRIVGSFQPTSPIEIDPTVTGLNVTFSVTNNGATIMGDQPDGSGTNVGGFGGGPFSPSFTLLN